MLCLFTDWIYSLCDTEDDELVKKNRAELKGQRRDFRTGGSLVRSLDQQDDRQTEVFSCFFSTWLSFVGAGVIRSLNADNRSV